MTQIRRYTVFSLLLFLLGCLDPYDPDLPPSASDVVVIDGFLDTKTGSAQVKIQRSLSLQSKERPNIVQGAEVTITSSNGEVTTLREGGQPGMYLASKIATRPGNKYALRVVMSDGKEYFSEDVGTPETPPIDSITMAVAVTGEDLAFRVNTHSEKQSAFYTWDYVETYEYTAPMYSALVNTPNGPRNRTPEENVYRCWKSEPSTRIMVSSTRGLSADVVRNFELTTIARRSLKISERYSILVRQRVISEAEYNYLTLIQKTTESLGGLFDPMPAPVQGNLHSKDLAEPVLGYFRAGNIEEKRFFIGFTELPEYFQKLPLYECEVFSTCTKPPPAPGNGITPPCIKIEEIPEYWPLLAQYQSGLSAYYWTYTSEKCGDCRKAGGTTQRPAFW